MKRAMSVVVAVLMCCSVFSGCGKDKNSAGGSSELGFKGYPIQTEESLTYWEVMSQQLASTEQNFGNSPLAKALAEKTGVKVEYIHPPVGQELEQLGILLSTDDLPDIIGNNWYNYSGGPTKAINEKVILPLGDVIEKYAPNLKAYLAKNTEVNKMVQTDDGKYYVFPFIRGDEILCTSRGIMVRQDWLNELKLSMPETIDEWHNVLAQFKEKKGAVAPLVYANEMLPTGGFIGAFGIKRDFFVEDGKVVYGPADVRFKDFLSTFAQWYGEGLIDENIANVDTKAMNANILNGKSGAIYGYAGSAMGQYNKSLQEKDPAAFLAPAPYVTSAKGTKPKFAHMDMPYPGAGSAAITTGCKNVELAARFLDYGYSEEGELLYNFGIEGESYNMKDEYPTYTDMIMKNPDGLTISQAMSRYIRANTSGPFVQRREYVEQYYETQPQKDALTVWGEGETEKYRLPAVTFTPEESAELASIMTNVNTFVDERTMQFIMGKESIDSFDGYMQTLEQYGIGRAVEIYNAAYQRYINRK